MQNEAGHFFTAGLGGYSEASNPRPAKRKNEEPHERYTEEDADGMDVEERENFEPVSDRLIHKRPNLMDRPPVGPQRANQPLYASSFSTFNGVMPVVTPTLASSSIPAPISSPTTNQSTAVVPHHHRYHQLSLLLASGTNFEAPDSYQVSVAPYTTTSAVVPHHHHNRRPSQASTNSSHGTLYNTDTEMAMDDPATPAGYDLTTPAGWDQMQDEGINTMSVSAPPAFEQNKPPSDMD